MLEHRFVVTNGSRIEVDGRPRSRRPSGAGYGAYRSRRRNRHRAQFPRPPARSSNLPADPCRAHRRGSRLDCCVRGLLLLSATTTASPGQARAAGPTPGHSALARVRGQDGDPGRVSAAPGQGITVEGVRYSADEGAASTASGAARCVRSTSPSPRPGAGRGAPGAGPVRSCGRTADGIAFDHFYVFEVGAGQVEEGAERRPSPTCSASRPRGRLGHLATSRTAPPDAYSAPMIKVIDGGAGVDGHAEGMHDAAEPSDTRAVLLFNLLNAAPDWRQGREPRRWSTHASARRLRRIPSAFGVEPSRARRRMRPSSTPTRRRFPPDQPDPGQRSAKQQRQDRTTATPARPRPGARATTSSSSIRLVARAWRHRRLRTLAEQARSSPGHHRHHRLPPTPRTSCRRPARNEMDEKDAMVRRRS